uniref:Uncharacterized protein n=1 Tax=Anopheles coluzzii TaxID=1518534 RepID=A0A8W7PDF3_ANOCL
MAEVEFWSGAAPPGIASVVPSVMNAVRCGGSVEANLMQCVAPTHEAVTSTVTHTPKYIFCASSEQHDARHAFTRDVEGRLEETAGLAEPEPPPLPTPRPPPLPSSACGCDVGVSQPPCIPPVTVMPIRLSWPSCWLEVTESECYGLRLFTMV